ncbi:MAG TPA: hypothetical protein VMU60_12415 [Syntrophobacteria bacterium]|nr:hypothetical protein [Syntrophobacteria bacterium]
MARIMAISLALALPVPADVLKRLPETRPEVPITKAVTYGGFDNEVGSYGYMVGEGLVSVAELMR